MARLDHYGPQIERLLARAAKPGKGGVPRGVSITEMTEKIGCTEGRVRQWIKANPYRVRQVGSNKYGARLWVLDDSGSHSGTTAAGRGAESRGVLPAIRVGGALEVAAIRESSAGRVVIEVTVGGKRALATIETLDRRKGVAA